MIIATGVAVLAVVLATVPMLGTGESAQNHHQSEVPRSPAPVLQGGKAETPPVVIDDQSSVSGQPVVASDVRRAGDGRLVTVAVDLDTDFSSIPVGWEARLVGDPHSRGIDPGAPTDMPRFGDSGLRVARRRWPLGSGHSQWRRIPDRDPSARARRPLF